MSETVSFDEGTLKRLKKAYAECEDGKTFMFEGNEYLKAYAKYLIEYLEARFKRRNA